MTSCNSKTTTTSSKDTTEEDSYYVKYITPESQVLYWLITEKKYDKEITASQAIEYLISDKDNFITKEIKLLDLKIKDRTAYVDVSSDIERTADGGYCGDAQITTNVYSIVNTLCLNNSFNIDRVELLVDHKENPGIGDFIFEDPLTATFQFNRVP